MYISGVVIAVIMSVILSITAKSGLGLIERVILFAAISATSWLGVFILFKMSSKLPID